MPAKKKNRDESKIEEKSIDLLNLSGFAKNFLTLEKSEIQLQQEETEKKRREKKENYADPEDKLIYTNQFDTLESEAPIAEDPFQRRFDAIQNAPVISLTNDGLHLLQQHLSQCEQQLQKTEDELLAKQKEITVLTLQLEEQRHLSSTKEGYHNREAAQLEASTHHRFELQAKLDEALSELQQADVHQKEIELQLSRLRREDVNLHAQLAAQKNLHESAQQQYAANTGQMAEEIKFLQNSLCSLNAQLKDERMRFENPEAASGEYSLKDMVHSLQTKLRDQQEECKCLERQRRQDHIDFEARIAADRTSLALEHQRVLDVHTRRAQQLALQEHGLVQVFENPTNMGICSFFGLWHSRSLFGFGCIVLLAFNVHVTGNCQEITSKTLLQTSRRFVFVLFLEKN